MEDMMFGRILGIACALFTVAALSLGPASAAEVIVSNSSPNCAWITVYGDQGLGWKIVQGSARPRNLQPGQSYRFELGSQRDVKVRAEVYRSGCNHPLAADVSKHLGRIAGAGVSLTKKGNSFSF